MLGFSRHLVLMLLVFCFSILAGLLGPASVRAFPSGLEVSFAATGPVLSPEIAPPLPDSFPASHGVHFDRPTTEHGLSQNTVTSILQNCRGFKWFGIGDGLNKYDGHNSTVYRHDPGELARGGVNGFNAFHPEQFTGNTYLPPIVATSLRLLDEVLRCDLAPDERVELSYQDNSLSVEFAALDYHAPDKNQRASNNAGVWSEQDDIVQITINPPFWGTWWFRGLIGLLLVGTVIGAYRLRVRSIEARSRELEYLVGERTAQLQRESEGRAQIEAALRESERVKAIVAERTRIARELHDSVTQSLYAVTLYADAASRRLSSGQMEGASEDLQKLGRTAKDALGEMRLLIFELRPPILDEAGLSAALQARLENVEKRSGLQTEFHAEGTGQLPCEVEDGLYRVALEGLNNVLKHAQASRVTMTLHHDAQSALLQLSDNGVGFDPAATSNGGGMGLAGMAERVEQFGGRLVVDSDPGQGTKISVEWKEEE